MKLYLQTISWVLEHTTTAKAKDEMNKTEQLKKATYKKANLPKTAIKISNFSILEKESSMDPVEMQSYIPREKRWMERRKSSHQVQ